MDFESLHEEIIITIAYILPLKDIRSLSLVCHHTENVSKIDWNKYFISHTGVSVSLLENFNPIDKQFMIDHGRYLLNVVVENIEQYLSVWKDLVKLDICNTFYNIEFDPDGEVTFISFEISNPGNDTSGIMFSFYQNEEGSGPIVELELVDGNTIDSKPCILSEIYMRFRAHLLKLKFISIILCINGDIVFNSNQKGYDAVYGNDKNV